MAYASATLSPSLASSPYPPQFNAICVCQSRSSNVIDPAMGELTPCHDAPPQSCTLCTSFRRERATGTLKDTRRCTFNPGCLCGDDRTASGLVRAEWAAVQCVRCPVHCALLLRLHHYFRLYPATRNSTTCAEAFQTRVRRGTCIRGFSARDPSNTILQQASGAKGWGRHPRAPERMPTDDESSTHASQRQEQYRSIPS
ncbi:hypothetical protein E4U21_002075 [Claviceps maximensis]|nr:hypothetical protein E4U21_002075 [Claviceps maximensis]